MNAYKAKGAQQYKTFDEKTMSAVQAPPSEDTDSFWQMRRHSFSQQFQDTRRMSSKLANVDPSCRVTVNKIIQQDSLNVTINCIKSVSKVFGFHLASGRSSRLVSTLTFIHNVIVVVVMTAAVGLFVYKCHHMSLPNSVSHLACLLFYIQGLFNCVMLLHSQYNNHYGKIFEAWKLYKIDDFANVDYVKPLKLLRMVCVALTLLAVLVFPILVGLHHFDVLENAVVPAKFLSENDPSTFVKIVSIVISLYVAAANILPLTNQFLFGWVLSKELNGFNKRFHPLDETKVTQIWRQHYLLRQVNDACDAFLSPFCLLSAVTNVPLCFHLVYTWLKVRNGTDETVVPGSLLVLAFWLVVTWVHLSGLAFLSCVHSKAVDLKNRVYKSIYDNAGHKTRESAEQHIYYNYILQAINNHEVGISLGGTTKITRNLVILVSSVLLIFAISVCHADSQNVYTVVRNITLK